MEVRHQRDCLDGLVHWDPHRAVRRLGLPVDGNIGPRHYGAAESGGARVVRVAFELGGELHYCIVVERRASEHIGGNDARHCRGGGRAQTARLRNGVVADHPQTRCRHIRGRETGLDGPDHEVGAIARQVVGTFAEDLHLQA